MAEYQMTHSGAELDEAVGCVLDNYKDVTPVTARAQDVVFGKIIVTPEGPVMGTYQGVVPPASWRKTAAGDPAVVSDGMAGWPLHGLSAEITPTQSGSGDPSPTNVRPIGGRDGAEVTQNGAAAVSVEFPETPGTVYGGVMNFKTGVLTVTHRIRTLNGSESWSTWNNTSHSVRLAVTDMKGQETGDPSDSWTEEDGAACDSLPVVSANAGIPCIRFYKPTPRIYIYWAASIDPSITSAATLKTWLESHPIDVVYPLAEPVTYQLTPQEMPLLAAGTNSFAADTGGVTVTYYSAPDDPTNPTVQSLQSSPAALSMAAPTADPMDEPEEVIEE